jgi:hypothetical protein
LVKQSPSVVVDPPGKKKYILIVLWLFTTVLLCACRSVPASHHYKNPTPTKKEEMLVPRWYAKIPELPGCDLAYAYSGVYINPDRQEQALIESGAANLAKSKRVMLEVRWAGSQKSSQTQTANFIKESEWEQRAQSIEKNIKIIKTYHLDQSMLALVGICPGQSDEESLASKLDDTLVNIGGQEPPSWISQPLHSSGQVFGAGSAASRITPAKAWQEAERQARADLAIALAGEIKILERNYGQNDFAYIHVLSETSAKLTLKELQVIRHAYSHNDTTFYALVSMPAIARE